MRYLLSLLILAGLVSPSFAHEMNAAVSTVLFNARSGNIEVMHRFYVHDAEHAVKQLFDKQADLLNNEQTQQTFSQYVTEQFALTHLNGEPIALTLIGGQLDGRFFWVYQEAVRPDDLPGLRVRHRSLQEIWPKQINTVNIESMNGVKTLSFDKNMDWLDVKF